MLEYQLTTPFVQPALVVSAADAVEYADVLLAGVDNLLIELGDNLTSSLLDELAEPQKRRFATIISEHIETARAAADEFTSG